MVATNSIIALVATLLTAVSAVPTVLEVRAPRPQDIIFDFTLYNTTSPSNMLGTCNQAIKPKGDFHITLAQARAGACTNVDYTALRIDDIHAQLNLDCRVRIYDSVNCNPPSHGNIGSFNDAHICHSSGPTNVPVQLKSWDIQCSNLPPA